MAPRPKWWHQLQASKHEVLLAMDLYNRASQERSLEGFIVHMQIAWLYLCQAHFTRTNVDYWYRGKNGRRIRGDDGEFRSWDLRRCLRELIPSENDPVRRNVEFFIGLRDKIEHRYEKDIDPLVAGKAQALIANYEAKLTELFGEAEGVAEEMRFPVFLSSLSGGAVDALKKTYRRLPKRITAYIREFDEGLPDAVKEDQGYEFRVLLIPQTGPKSTTDVAMTFVRMDDLDEQQREELERFKTVVREKSVPVHNLDRYTVSEVVRMVKARTGLRFSINDHTRAWKNYKVRPARASARPERTRGDFCEYDKPHGDYVYTEAWVSFLSKELVDPEKYEAITGRQPEAVADAGSESSDG